MCRGADAVDGVFRRRGACGALAAVVGSHAGFAVGCGGLRGGGNAMDEKKVCRVAGGIMSLI